ncbi:DNA annealing helicase and endonuclease ZRANB3 isoform X2 [Canna indica]|uniref:DNA annealing helicase and endonuclease ZRANB3 isoform X2 n=1 Tax=Canna indica TaxID=4628 RepID=A0AAQ3PXK5_9LILI|nr:DNA annealing helicase and endonuclease ZRANB3 isoform X2 [Canna indica]
MLWPGLLGKDKYEFAKNYCSIRFVRGSNGVIFKDFSRGIRLGELNILLRQTVMVRRLKEHVLTQLPPKRRQIIWVVLKASDILLAIKSCRTTDTISVDGEQNQESSTNCCSDQSVHDGDQKLEENDSFPGYGCRKAQKHLPNQEIGIAKLSGFREWFSNHFAFRESDDEDNLEMRLFSQKTIIFAHHLKVLDGIQAFICEKGIKFVRLDGSTLGRERKHAIEAFRFSEEVMIAIVGITVGSCGLNFSSAQNVIFLELPETSAEMIQAEDRAHRQGQRNAVNIYIFCAKNTSDESRWLRLNKSFFCCSSMTNGKKFAIKQIEVGSVLHLEYSDNPSSDSDSEGISTGDFKGSSVDQSIQTIETYCGTEERLEVNAHYKQDHKLGAEEHFIIHEKQNINKYEGGNAEQLNPDSVCNTIQSCKGDLEFDLLESSGYKEENQLAGMSKPAIVDEYYNTRAEWLRFEVSQYTGRVHLHIWIPGKDSRPRPLFENFRPEELKSIVSAGYTCKDESSETLKRNPAYWNIFEKFFEEWNSLRPIERNKLLGKPVQLPLIAELCYLKESNNHGREGLLRGGSKRRITPLSDISRPLPENSVWKKITLRCGSAMEREYTQAWTTDDLPLCKLCQEPCNGKLAKAPEYFEDLFCNLSCFQEYRIRTSQRALREALFQIEHGVCTLCKLDCHELVKCIKPLSKARRMEYIKKVAPKLAQKQKLLDKLVHEPNEGNAWHADHIIPVYKGGGECTLENMRTLCVACHSEVTVAQQHERRSARKRAKKHLQIAMKQLENTEHFNFTNDGVGEKHDAEEDILLIKVPGSVYSTSEHAIVDNLDNGVSRN